MVAAGFTNSGAVAAGEYLVQPLRWALISFMVVAGVCNVLTKMGNMFSDSGCSIRFIWVIMGVEEVKRVVGVFVWVDTAMVGAKWVSTSFSTNV